MASIPSISLMSTANPKVRFRRPNENNQEDQEILKMARASTPTRLDQMEDKELLKSSQNCYEKVRALSKEPTTTSSSTPTTTTTTSSSSSSSTPKALKDESLKTLEDIYITSGKQEVLDAINKKNSEIKDTYGQIFRRLAKIQDKRLLDAAVTAGIFPNSSTPEQPKEPGLDLRTPPLQRESFLKRFLQGKFHS